jgi:hypothetical protein
MDDIFDTTMTLEQARSTPSESGMGWCLNGYTPYLSGVPCWSCGKFVGRDGYIGVEHFEMSMEIASVEGQCVRCIRENSD